MMTIVFLSIVFWMMKYFLCATRTFAFLKENRTSKHCTDLLKRKKNEKRMNLIDQIFARENEEKRTLYFFQSNLT